jgi:hypothetical protein
MPRTRGALANAPLETEERKFPAPHLAGIVRMFIADCAGQW